MYSVVLMAAMTTGGAETPAFFFKHRAACNGCYASCYGCYGVSHGCYASCHGCYASCYGCYGACYGCYGVSHGCSGWHSWRAHRYHGTGCYGLTCHGCYGSGYGCSGACYCGVAAPMIYQPVAPAVAPSATPAVPEVKPEGGDTGATEGVSTGDSAHLILEIPEGADLYIDGKLMPAKTGTRRFHTPKLEPGQAFFYDVRVVTERDGKSFEENKRVIVRAGQTISEEFDGLIPAEPRTFVSTD